MVCIDGRLVHTKELELESACCMMVEAGTNGYHGGDRENGSRTYLRLTALNKADFFARLKNNDAGQPIGVELCFCGDDGLNNVLKALDFAKQVLTDQISEENS